MLGSGGDYMLPWGFLLEQTCDESLHHEQLRVINGQILQPEFALTYVHLKINLYIILNIRVYQVRQDTENKKCYHCGSAEPLFQVAHYNPIVGH